MQQRLDEVATREVLARAEEIHLHEQIPVELGEGTNDLVRAAEEAGLSRSAVTQALRERLATQRTPLEPGSLVLAEAGQGKLYAAEVLELSPGHAKVRFMSGVEASVSREDVEPFQMFPGQVVRCPWPNWGWWTCTVVSYDHKKKKVKATDNWGGKETFNLGDIYVERKSAHAKSPAPLTATMFLAGMGATGILGALITWFLMR